MIQLQLLGLLLLHHQYSDRPLLAPDDALKIEMPIMFSQSHHIDVEEDLLLQLQRLQPHRDSRLDDCPLNDIYSRANLLIL